MKLRWVGLLVVIVAGAGLSYHLFGGGGTEESPDTPQEPKKKQQQVASGNPSKKKSNEASKKGAEESQEEKKPAGEYRLPDNSGGRLVSRVTGPPARLPESKQVAPLRRPAPRSIEDPSLPLPPQELAVPRLRDPGRRPTRPELVAPEPLFGLEELIGALPESLSFPALDRIRLLGVDVSLPVALPRMAQPVAEARVLADPTLDMSKADVLSAPLPPRDVPAPFIRLSLPDPFEHQDTVRLTTPGEEMPDPNVRPPRK